MSDGNEIECLFFNLTKLKSHWQFIILSLTVFAFHLVQGYMHELIFKLPGFKPYSMFLTLLQFGIYSFLAIVETLIKHKCDLSIVLNKK